MVLIGFHFLFCLSPLGGSYVQAKITLVASILGLCDTMLSLKKKKKKNLRVLQAKSPLFYTLSVQMLNGNVCFNYSLTLIL